MSGDIAVGVDGSTESLAAVDWGADEAARRDAQLRLVSATRWEKHPNIVMPSYAAEDWGRWWLEKAEQQVLERHPRLRMSTKEVEDAPVEVLLSATEGARMLVLGSRGLGEGGAFLLGSVGQAAVAQAAVPVVLVRPAEAQSEVRREVVLGLDVRHPGDELLEFAFEAAVQREAVLRIVHTWRFPAAHWHESEEREQSARHEAARALDGAVEPWRRKFPKLRVGTDVAEGRAAQHLFASAQGAELLVVGRRREKEARLGHHVGAVTHAVIHHVPCPVAVVPHA